MSKVAVIGLGKLGVPLAVVLASKGHSVTGLDLDPGPVELINRKIPPIQETDLDEMLHKHPFIATTSNTELVKRSDTAFIIVPTPSNTSGKFTNRYVLDAIKALGEALQGRKRYYNVVICSTVMPGSCDYDIRKELESASGRTVGDTLGLCYSPEFIAIGSVIHDLLNPDMVLIGQSDDKAGTSLARIMRSVSNAPIRKMSLGSAEVAKISVNAFVTMKISFANTLSELCETIPGASAHEVANAIGLDRRIGRAYLSPATAFGGPCFPRDNRAFARASHSIAFRAPLAVATDTVNMRQSERIMEILRKLPEFPTQVTILGMAYKPNTGLTEESPGVELAEYLTIGGIDVRVHDPMAVLPQEAPYKQVATIGDAIGTSKVAVIMTPWPLYADIAPGIFESRHDLVIIDCWNVIQRGPWDDLHVIRLGEG